MIRVGVVILAAVSLGPVALLVVRALGSSWRYPSLLPTLDTSAVLLDPRLREALVTSIGIALATGLLATLIGLPAGRALRRGTGRWRSVGRMAAFLPVITPPIALGIGVQVATLRLGIGGTGIGVLLGHLVPATGYVTLYLLGVLGAYDERMEEAARTLGATRWQVMRRVVLPALRGPLVEAVALGALVSWGQLALTLVIGGGVVRTLPVELLAYVRSGDDRLGALAALLLTIPPVLAFGLVRRGARQTGVAA